MVYRGHVRNGRIELDEQVALPEGAEVQVNLAGHPAGEQDKDVPTLYEQLKSIIGTVEDLPSDLSINHPGNLGVAWAWNHPLRGAPRQALVGHRLHLVCGNERDGPD